MAMVYDVPNLVTNGRWGRIVRLCSRFLCVVLLWSCRKSQSFRAEVYENMLPKIDSECSFK